MSNNEYVESAKSSKMEPEPTCIPSIPIEKQPSVVVKVNKKIRTIQQFMQFAAQIKTFKAYCEKFESDKKKFNSNKLNILSLIDSLKSDFVILQNFKLSVEKKKSELSDLSELYNFSLIELSLGKISLLNEILILSNKIFFIIDPDAHDLFEEEMIADMDMSLLNSTQ